MWMTATSAGDAGAPCGYSTLPGAVVLSFRCPWSWFSVIRCWRPSLHLIQIHLIPLTFHCACVTPRCHLRYLSPFPFLPFLSPPSVLKRVCARATHSCSCCAALMSLAPPPSSSSVLHSRSLCASPSKCVVTVCLLLPLAVLVVACVSAPVCLIAASPMSPSHQYHGGRAWASS